MNCVPQSRPSHGARRKSLVLLAPLLAAPFWLTGAPALAQDAEGDSQDQPLELPAPPADADLPEVETIISDEEFAEEVPSLDEADDEALYEELESIDEFERRIAAQDGEAEPGDEAPLGDPSLADGDTTEEIEDAPVRDAELAAPLQPIDTLLSEPFEYAEAEAPPVQSELHYRVALSGVEEAQAASETDLVNLFDDLSALKDGDGEAANIAQLRARMDEDAELVRRILASEGWYSADVRGQITGEGEGDEQQTFVATIDAVPGPRYVFSDIVIDAPETRPEGLIKRELSLDIGDPIVAAEVLAGEAKVLVGLPEWGYPFAELGQRDLLLDQESGEGVYTLPVDPGPLSVFGGIETSGDLVFDEEHVELLARFKRGELYDNRLVEDLRQALVATSLFSTVTVSPQRSGEPAPDGAEYATLLVEQNAGPPRTIAGSAGYGTGQGFRVEGSWTHRNLFPPEGALIASGVLGTQEQGASATFRRSNAGRRDRTFTLTAQARHTDYDAYEAYTGRLGVLWSYSSTSIWQKPFTYAYGGQVLISNEQDFDLATEQRVRRTFYVGGLTGQFGIDRSDDLLNPTKGFRTTLLVEPEGSLEGGFSPYVRAQLDGSAYFPATSSIVLAGRVRFGTIQGASRYDLAPSRRFYAGGGGSVRGFGYQDLGPTVMEPNPDYPAPEDIEPGTDPEDLPDEFIPRNIGGRSLFEAAAEVRYRFGNFGVAAFVDAGQAWEETSPQFTDIRYGVGVGGRYYTNFGPLRLDVAMPIDRRTGESSFAVYVSIGQAF
ncbi:autotransporter assembly complex protein TamA [Aurantiacibacter suaedae]|uniref:autotransporter assembly complex protein TamA n=1 Tax=Aurantiacibacter suaedae TaxID=2545755 RepID=UPI0010F68B85|nr:BamA/TamA family outer membrane protein [Aurantiacibacter suaedae]